MKKGPVELGSDEEEGESESKVIHQIFGRLQFPKNEVRYLENIFLILTNIDFHYFSLSLFLLCSSSQVFEDPKLKF